MDEAAPDVVPAPDDVGADAGDVTDTCVPSASVVVVVTDPSLLVIDAVASSAARSESELDPLLHDACPVAWLADPSLFGGARCHAAVDWRDGPTAGHVRAWFGERDDAPGAPNVEAMLAVRNDALLELVAAAIARLP